MPNSLSTPLRGGAIGSTLSLGAKGLILIAIPVFCQLLMLYLLRQVQNHGIAAEAWSAHSKQVIAEADEVYRLMLQAVAGQRAAAITGEAEFDRGPQPGVITARLDQLQVLVTDNAEQQARVRALREDGAALDTWTAAQVDLVRAGRAREALARIAAGDGRDRLDRIDAVMTEFLGAERRLDEARAAELRAVNSRGRLYTTIAAAVSLIVAGLVGFVFSRSISSRLATVTSNAGRLAAGEPLAAPVAGTDEIAQLDAVLHDSSQRLADAAAAADRAREEVERRAEELARVNHELHQQTQENELFIYSVSHDLRSPLVNLQGFSKELVRSCDDLRRLLHDEAMPPALRPRIAGVADQEIPEAVHFIRTAVTRASAIIDALLRLSRVGRVEYQWQPVEVARTITTVLDAMRSTINERRAQITVQPLEPAWGDPTAVEQVFANLIGNAVNYLDPNRPGRVDIGMLPIADETAPAASASGATSPDQPAGGRVTESSGRNSIIARGASVDGPAMSDTRFHTYFVRDNGLGIPARSVDKVFVAFQRLHAQRAQGEGIGLAVVRRIVERHRGRIWVESTEGEGSTFYVMLPRDAAAAGVAAEPAAPVASSIAS